MAERTHPLDQVSLGRIVVIREQLMAAAAAGQRVYGFESGDPSFDLAPHVRAALQGADEAGRTHYGIPELWAALAATTGSQEYVRRMCDEYRVRRDIMLDARGGIDGARGQSGAARAAARAAA